MTLFTLIYCDKADRRQERRIQWNEKEEEEEEKNESYEIRQTKLHIWWHITVMIDTEDFNSIAKYHDNAWRNSHLWLIID